MVFHLLVYVWGKFLCFCGVLSGFGLSVDFGIGFGFTSVWWFFMWLLRGL
jgi:hypothetical protein